MRVQEESAISCVEVSPSSAAHLAMAAKSAHNFVREQISMAGALMYLLRAMHRSTYVHEEER
jgi:hypothetical protein